MEIQTLLRALRPLLPEEVRRWERVLEQSDAKMKNLVEQHVRNTARAVLGESEDKVYLSLPPRALAKGPIHVGVVEYEAPKWPFGLSESEFLQHVAVLGRSGAGKSNVVFHLMLQLVARNTPLLFLDQKRTARHVLPLLAGSKLPIQIFTPGRALAPFPFNPFLAPPGIEPQVYREQVLDALSDAYSLGDGARSVLQRALAACADHSDSVPTLASVRTALKDLPLTGRAANWRASAQRALESVRLGGLADSEPAAQEQLAHALLEQCTILELDSLSDSVKRFLVPMLCLWLYAVRLESDQREALRFVIVVEEAHHVLYGAPRARETIMEMLLRQCRELGLAFIIVDQHPHLLSSAALGNTFTSICLNLKDPRDIARAGALSGVLREDCRLFSELPVGQAVVKLQDRWRSPFRVAIPSIDISKGAVTDALLRGYLTGNLTLSGLYSAVSGKFAQAGRSRLGVHGVSLDEQRFLEDVRRFPTDGVQARYDRLGMSAHRGTRMKERLLRAGIIESTTVSVGRTRRVVLRIAPGQEDAADPAKRGSLEHAFWISHCSQDLVDLDYTVTPEAHRRVGGRVDLVATREGEHLAIEVETGKSDVVDNVRRDLLEGFDRVLVVATSNEALRTVERQLARAGLLLPPRVEVLRGDDLAKTLDGVK